MSDQETLPTVGGNNESPTDRVNSSGLQGETRVLARLKARSLEADNQEIYFGETA